MTRARHGDRMRRLRRLTGVLAIFLSCWAAGGPGMAAQEPVGTSPARPADVPPPPDLGPGAPTTFQALGYGQ